MGRIPQFWPLAPHGMWHMPTVRSDDAIAVCGMAPERMFKLNANAAGIEHTFDQRIGGQKPNAPGHGIEEQIGGNLRVRP